MVNEDSERTPLFRLGLIGYPLGHSFSADYFNSKFKELNIPGEYRLYPIEKISQIHSLIEDDPILIGLNVTIPYKQAVIPYLDELSPDALEIGAVNVITIRLDKQKNKGFSLKGYNTDWIGFRESISPLLTHDMDKALILGTGGSSKAVAYALKKSGLRLDYTTRSRSRETATEGRYYTYDELNEDIIRDHRLIINTTPLGMYPKTEGLPPIPYNALSNEHLCYDLIYNPGQTSYMKACRDRGATVKNGLEMLRLQAEGTWSIMKPLIKGKMRQ